MSYGTQGEIVYKVLRDALGPEDVEVIAALLGGNIDEISPPSATTKKRILDLIRWAERSAKEEALITTAMEEVPTNRALALVGPSVLQSLAAVTWYTPPDPLETCIVGSDQAFVDRSDLRKRVRQLIPANGWRALIVHGEERTGRSFTFELISFVIDHMEDHQFAHIDLSTAPNLGPGDVVRGVAFQLALDTQTMPTQQEQAPRWNADLRDWLVGRVEASGITSWLIVDAIDKARPSDAVMDFLWKVAATAKIRPRLRVVLLGCSEPIPDDVRALEEEIGPITQELVEDYFGLFVEHKRVPGTPEELVALARRATGLALANVPPSGPDRLETLQQEVAKVARWIVEGRV